MRAAELLNHELPLHRMVLKNRIVRAATFEGMARADGNPKRELAGLYARLFEGGAGTVITGFMSVSREGRAMHPGQCRMEHVGHAEAWRALLSGLRERVPSACVIAQIAHAGRQTRSNATGMPAVGAGSVPCSLFREPVHELDVAGTQQRVEQFARAARLAEQAGFDGVQLHGAHGYLIHQFLSPWTNRRGDCYADPPRFLLDVVAAVREACGRDFPVWLKLSYAEDRPAGIRLQDTIETVCRLGQDTVDALVISYGTMEWPMNIFRGGCPLGAVMRINPLIPRGSVTTRVAWYVLRGVPHRLRLRRFHENYTAGAAAEIQRHARVPVIPVGGIRSGGGVRDCLESKRLAAIALCRPLICDPGFSRQLLSDEGAVSGCRNCNLCAVSSDSRRSLRCYRRHMECRS